MTGSGAAERRGPAVETGSQSKSVDCSAATPFLAEAAAIFEKGGEARAEQLASARASLEACGG
jgi:hypothetical protein